MLAKYCQETLYYSIYSRVTPQLQVGRRKDKGPFILPLDESYFFKAFSKRLKMKLPAGMTAFLCTIRNRNLKKQSWWRHKTRGASELLRNTLQYALPVSPRQHFSAFRSNLARSIWHQFTVDNAKVLRCGSAKSISCMFLQILEFPLRQEYFGISLIEGQWPMIKVNSTVKKKTFK